MSRARKGPSGEPHIRSFFVQPFVQFVREGGGDPEEIIEEFGLQSAVDGTTETLIPLSQFKTLFERAAELLRDPFLGVHMAKGMRRGTFGILEFCTRSAPTLGEGFQRLVRYASLLSEIVVVSFEEVSGSAIFEFSIPGHPNAFGRHPNEFFISALIEQAPSLLGQPLRPERCWFEHDQPSSVSEIVELFQTDYITFGAPTNGLSFPATMLSRPLTTSDPPLLSLLDQQATQALAQQAPFPSFEAEVRSTLRRHLRSTGAAPTLAVTASTLRISARTLQRKLSAEGSSFSHAMGAAREELARLYVGDAKHTLSEIAFLLGYTELSPFTRAFKRWTGMTPTEFRARRTQAQ